MKKCPFCAEEIQDEAILCRHCGASLEIDTGESVNDTKKCPYCAETIKISAILCRYCRNSLEPDNIRLDETTTCPYCAEITSKESGYCEYCANPLTQLNENPEVDFIPPHQGDKRLKSGLVLFCFAMILVVNFAVAYWLYQIFLTNPDFTNYAFMLAINLIVRLIIGSWALRDRSYIKDLSYAAMAGVMILAFIPIGSWFAIYYAARHLSRSLTSNNEEPVI